MANLTALSNDKAFLESVIQKEFELPDSINAFSFCLELLPNLGSTDPVLRDELTFTILLNLLTNAKKIKSDEAGRILSVCLDDDHLLSEIGERNRDSVFLRSFSALTAAVVIERDSIERKLDPEILLDSMDRLLRYSTMEQDFRGFVHNKGWAHSLAHLGDALNAFAIHPATTEEALKRILECTGSISVPEHPLSNGEDNRLSHAAFDAIARISDRRFVLNWIDSFPDSGNIFESIYKRYNAQHFLRSLYFLVKWEGNDEELLGRIEERLKNLHYGKKA